jgi:hypothetical protein
LLVSSSARISAPALAWASSAAYWFCSRCSLSCSRASVSRAS